MLSFKELDNADDCVFVITGLLGNMTVHHTLFVMIQEQRSRHTEPSFIRAQTIDVDKRRSYEGHIR